MTTTAYPFRKALATSSGSTSFIASPVPTETKPSGDGIIDLFSGTYGLGVNTYLPDEIQVVPYMTAADDVTGGIRIYGWSRTSDATAVWIPQLLAELAITAGNIAATLLAANGFLCDTITVTDGGAGGDGTGASKIDPQSNTPGSIMIHLRGCELIQFDCSKNSGTATLVNALWRGVDHCR